jgi:hypothetical protein
VLLLLVLLLLVLGQAGRPEWCGRRTVTDLLEKESFILNVKVRQDLVLDMSKSGSAKS